MKSKWTKPLMSSELSMTTTLPRLVRWISGMAVSSSSLRKAHLVYSRKHFPGATVDRGLGNGRYGERDAMPVFGLYEICLAKPGSIT